MLHLHWAQNTVHNKTFFTVKATSHDHSINLNSTGVNSSKWTSTQATKIKTSKTRRLTCHGLPLHSWGWPHPWVWRGPETHLGCAGPAPLTCSHTGSRGTETATQILYSTDLTHLGCAGPAPPTRSHTGSRGTETATQILYSTDLRHLQVQLLRQSHTGSRGTETATQILYSTDLTHLQV